MAKHDLLSGLLIGGLVGVAAGLLMAPHSGEETLLRLREQGQGLRDKATQTAEETRAKAEHMKERGRELVAENRERIIRTAEAVKRTAQETWSEGQAGKDQAVPSMMAQRMPDRWDVDSPSR